MRARVGVAATGVLLVAACSPSLQMGNDDESVTPTPVAHTDSATPTPTPAPSGEADHPDLESESGRTTGAESSEYVNALEHAVLDYTNAYFAGDWDVAFEALWSARCKADNEARNSFMGTLMAQEVNYPEPSDRPTPGAVTVVRLENSSALVDYSYIDAGHEFPITSQPWIYEGGRWRYDAC